MQLSINVVYFTKKNPKLSPGWLAEREIMEE